MSVGLSQYLAHALLDTFTRSVSFSVTDFYVKLHLGDPGPSGLLNEAAETARIAASFGAPSGGVQYTNADTVWPSVAANETPTHWSGWDTAGPTGGNFLWSGTLDAVAMVIDLDYTIPAGGIVFTVVGIAA